MRLQGRQIAIILIPLMLSGCLSDQQPSEEEKQQAMNDYIHCLHTAAAKMDDGKSDALTIAVAIKPFCAAEFARSVKLSGSGMSPYARSLFEQRVQTTQIELGTTAVLDHRKDAAGN